MYVLDSVQVLLNNHLILGMLLNETAIWHLVFWCEFITVECDTITLKIREFVYIVPISVAYRE